MDFCFECHSSSDDLETCSCGLRSFHRTCLKSASERQHELDQIDYHKKNLAAVVGPIALKNPPSKPSNEGADETTCYACTLLEKGRTRELPSMTVAETNYLLQFTINRVISWLPDDIPGVSEIKKKPSTQGYASLDEVLVDIVDLIHSTALEFGVGSMHHESSRYLLVDAMFEVDEIYQCPDCYRHSNEKSDSSWFARPCSNKRHDLVYAKMPSYPFWPAKVIKIIGNNYDVRFFGQGHARSLVSVHNVRPIDVDFKEIHRGKISSALAKSLKELELHRKLLTTEPAQYAFENEVKHGTPVKNVKNTRRKRAGPSSSQESESPKKVQKVNNNRSEPMSQEALSELETKQRTRGDIQKLIKNLCESPSKSEASSSENEAKSEEGDTSFCSTLQLSPFSSIAASVASEKDHQNGVTDAFKSPMDTPPKKALNREQNIAVLRLRRKLEPLDDVEEIKSAAEESIAKEVEIWQGKVNEFMSSYHHRVSDVKRKQWCIQCEAEAIYYCCWNNSYCSKDCQTKHWPLHKRKCQRKTST